MSYSIDNKIVEMQFDNSDFEKNANTSIETLDRLKNSLSMDGLADGLGSVEQAIGNISFDGFENGINHIGNQFSVLQSIAFSVIQNITNDVLNFGKRVVNEFSLEPINQGFSEYEMKMNSVQTIMASTGESIETVDKYLEELNKYADDTIYSFADMTANIGKFTNAGVKLEDAVAAIKGISNEAALSGANANEASRAMYNFAQALSAGYVKLIDWKSIENANMATVEFKTQLLDTAAAMGTVEKTSDGMYKVLSTSNKGGTMGELVDATHNFNDSLTYQWMTTEVLTKTLADYAGTEKDIGIRANEAATKVKTFTQLMDTLKEAAGSGWTETFQIIIGNLEEAKAFYTYLSDTFGDIINGQSKVRNDILKGWKEAGGRDAIIDALKYTISSITTLSHAISDAFKEFFPTITSEQLVKASEAIKELTGDIDTFITNNRTEFQNFFRGIFSVLDLFVDGIVGAAKAINKVFGNIEIDPYKILNAADSFGIFLVKITDLIRTTNPLILFASTVKKALTEISQTGQVIPVISKNIQEFISTIQKNLTLPGFELLNDVLFRIMYRLGHLKEIGNQVISVIKSVSDAFVNSDIYKTLQKLWEIAKEFGKALVDSFVSIGKSIKSKLEVAEFRDFVDLFNTLMTSGVLAFLNKMSRNLSDFAGFRGMISGLQELRFMFDNVVGDNLEKMQIYLSNLTGSVSAKTLLGIAGAIAILATSLIALTLVDSDKLLIGLGAITTLLGELVGAFKVVGNGKIWQTGSQQLTTLAISVGILALALRSLATLENIDNIGPALGAMTALLGEVVAAAIALSKNVGLMTKGLTGIVAMAVAVLILAKAVKSLGELDLAVMEQGLLGVMSLVAFMTVIAKEAKNVGAIKSVGFAMMEMAVSVAILTHAIKELGTMDLEVLEQGLLGVFVAIGSMTLLMKQVKVFNIKSVGFAMIEIATSLIILAAAIKMIDSLNPMQVTEGLFGIFTALMGILGFLWAMNTLNITNIVSAGAGLLLIAIALATIAASLTLLGSFGFETIMSGLTAMLIGLMGMAIALNYMKGSLSSAGALAVVSLSLIGFATALAMLSVIPFGPLVKSLIVIFGTLAILAFLAPELAPLAPVLMSIAGSFALMGVGVMALGAGLVLVGAGLTSVATGLLTVAGSGAGIVGAVIAIIGEILLAVAGLIPQVITTLIKGLGDTAKALIENAPTIIGAIVQVILLVCGALIQAGPTLIETVISILMDVIIALLTALDEHVVEIVDKLVSIILKICQTIVDHGPELVDAGVNVIVSLIQGITQQAPKLVDEGLKTIISFINGMAEALQTNTPELIDALDNLIDSAISALIQFVEWSLPELADIGINIISGVVNGITSCASEIGNALVSAASSAYNGVCDFLGIHSPSRLLRGTGRYTGQGLALGITDEEKNVTNSALELAKGATTALEDELEKGGNSATNNFMDILSNLLGFDIDGEYQPTITPLFDLSNIQNGMGLLQSIFSSPQLAMAETSFGTPTRSNDYESLGSLIDTSNREYADRIVNAIENLAGGISVEATIEGDMGRMFKIMKDENTKYRKSNGKGILD